MFGTMLFLHLTGLVLWLGGFIAIMILLLLVKKEPYDARKLSGRAIRLFNWIAQPSSLVVLISGIFMVVEMNFGETAKPFWLQFMEKGGGVIILLSLLLTTFLGRKSIKALTSEQKSEGARPKGNTAYLITLAVFALSIVSIIYVVSERMM